jgi:hypothetical protein
VTDINFWRICTAALGEEIKMCPLAVSCLLVRTSTRELPNEFLRNFGIAGLTKNLVTFEYLVKI